MARRGPVMVGIAALFTAMAAVLLVGAVLAQRALRPDSGLEGFVPLLYVFAAMVSGAAALLAWALSRGMGGVTRVVVCAAAGAWAGGAVASFPAWRSDDVFFALAFALLSPMNWADATTLVGALLGGLAGAAGALVVVRRRAA